ncbi:MAG: amidase family protein, partial [Pseudomonadota bacterium]
QKTNMPPEETGLLEPFTLGLAAAWRKRDADALPIAIAGLTQYQRAVREFLHGYDAWLTPVTPSPAPPIGELAPDVAFETLLERVSPFAAYTPIHNAAGTPALSIPAAMSATGLPIGAQLAAAHGQEALLLSLAYQLEEAAPWRDSHPRMHA